MKNYLFYGGFIIILIYGVHKFMKIILEKVKNNTYAKKDLLEYRDKYKKEIYEFKKLYDDIKILSSQNDKLQIEHNHLRKRYNDTKVYCNKLDKNLVGVGESIKKIYREEIASIYTNQKPIELNVDRRWLDDSEGKEAEYYEEIARKESTIKKLPPDPALKWPSY